MTARQTPLLLNKSGPSQKLGIPRSTMLLPKLPLTVPLVWSSLLTLHLWRAAVKSWEIFSCGPWWRPEMEPGRGGTEHRQPLLAWEAENSGQRKHCCLQTSNLRLGGNSLSLSWLVLMWVLQPSPGFPFPCPLQPLGAPA